VRVRPSSSSMGRGAQVASGLATDLVLLKRGGRRALPGARLRVKTMRRRKPKRGKLAVTRIKRAVMAQLILTRTKALKTINGAVTVRS
jgi:hypothetical protein